MPAGWTVRNISLRDVPLILAITRASDMASIGEPDWSTDEIVATLTAANHDPARDSWLAMDAAGEPVAWGYLDNPSHADRDNVEVYAKPAAGEPAYRPLLDLAITRVAQRALEAGYPAVTLRAGAIATEAAYVDALRDKGFVFVKRHARMRRPLTGDEVGAGDAAVPVGYLIRAVRPDDEAQLRRFHQVLQSAFADTPDFLPISYETWRETIANLPTSWDEWLVAMVDGAVVGVLQSAEQGVERNEGWVKNLAVLREHRNAGIGTALLREAFAIYAAKGRRWAGLGVDLTNPTGAYRLYTGVGMVPTFEADVYERPVTAGPPAAP